MEFDELDLILEVAEQLVLLNKSISCLQRPKAIDYITEFLNTGGKTEECSAQRRDYERKKADLKIISANLEGKGAGITAAMAHKNPAAKDYFQHMYNCAVSHTMNSDIPGSVWEKREEFRLGYLREYVELVKLMPWDLWSRPDGAIER